MWSDIDLSNPRFQFADSSHRVLAELSGTASGMSLRLFDEDGQLVAEFASPVSGVTVGVRIVRVLCSIELVRMLSGRANAA